MSDRILRTTLPGVLIVPVLVLLSRITILEQSPSVITVAFDESGVAQIHTEMPDSSDVKILVHTTQFTSDSFPYRTTYPYRKWCGWGAETKFPAAVVTSVDVRLNGKVLWVSMSAFSDIADPDSLSFRVLPVGFGLMLKGGDAGLSYRVELDFDDQALVYRRAYSAELPDSVREETKYGGTVTYDP